MTANILREAESDLETAFRYYELARRGLGIEMLGEFRSGIEQILRYPEAWQSLDEKYRRYRLHRFPMASCIESEKTGTRFSLLRSCI
jgi:hypothetical protein